MFSGPFQIWFGFLYDFLRWFHHNTNTFIVNLDVQEGVIGRNDLICRDVNVCNKKLRLFFL